MAVAFTHSPYTRQGCAATSVPAARPRLSSGCNLHTKPLFGCLATAALVASRTLKHKAHRQRRGAFQLASTQDDMCSDYLRFVNKTGSPAHTVAAAKELLLEAGFTELSDTGAAWVLEPGNGYFVTMQGTSIAAFGVGEQFGDGTSGGVVVAAAHTDSPCLKLRPCSKLPTKAGLLQLGVNTYGGGLWHTWFDRPLGMAGTIVVSTESGMEQRLVHIPEPLCVIPNLAIHLTNAEERKGFSPNTETQLRPVLCMPPEKQTAAVTSDAEGASSAPSKFFKGFGPKHHVELLEEIAKAADVAAERILDVDICLMDAAPACSMGQFVSSPRIDNVLSTWAAFSSLATVVKEGGLKDSSDVLVAASFDHEEVGSTSATGADSAVLGRWLEQALSGINDTKFAEVVSRSFLLSCDCAHGLHPNYASKHQNEHRPLLGHGSVIKTNANQRYATTPLLAQMVRELARRAETPMQEFVVRNDCPCGSTIGPLLSAQLGIRTVDVGAPQWAMHSIRETAHADDVTALHGLCKGLYQHWRDVDSNTVHL